MSTVRTTMRSAACAVALCLAACGGGGSSGAPALPGTSSTPAAQASAGPTAKASFTIDAPAGTTSSSSARTPTARTPKYVSSATQSVSIALQGQPTPLAVANISPTSPGCTSATGVGTTCTVGVVAPIGQDMFVVTAYDGTNGTGNVLSTATLSFTIALNATNTVPMVLNGVVASASVILSASSVPAGTPATVAVTVVALDAQQQIIIGPGSYTSAVTLTDTDPTGNTALSATSVTAPGTNTTLSYNGGSMMGATITPSVGGTPGTPATFAPAGTAVTTYLLPASIYGPYAMAPGPSGGAGGAVWVSSYDNSATLGSISSSGASNVFSKGLPNDYFNALAPASNGTEWFAGDNDEIGSIDTSGNVKVAGTFSNPCDLSSTCGQVNWMTLGPDGNAWFSDNAGYIGQVTNSNSVTEWDPTQLPGWPGGLTQPYQIAFGADGNLYVADEYQETVYKLVIAGDAPASVVSLSSTGCSVNNSVTSGVPSVAVGTDGNVWYSDDCGNLYAVPVANFTSGAVQSWSVANITTDDNSFGSLIATSGGIWTTDGVQGVYRISNTAGGGSPAQPAITTLTPFQDPDFIALGSDGNVWVAGGNNQNCGAPIQPLARITYGVPQLGALSVARNLPKAVRRSSSARAPLTQRRKPKISC